MTREQLQIPNRLGLHARAAAKLVSIASRHDCQLMVTRDNRCVDARSIMALLTLGAAQGTWLTVEASGEDADEAMAEVRDLFARNFDEQDTPD